MTKLRVAFYATGIVANVLVIAAIAVFAWSAYRDAPAPVVDNSTKTAQECQAKPADAVWPSCDRYN